MKDFYNAVLRPLRELDKRSRVMFAAIGAYNWANNLSMNYNQLYAVALGADPIELSSLNSFGSITSSAISVPTGWLIDRYGVKRIIIAGLIVCTIVSAIYGLATDWLMLLPAVMLMQVGFKLIIPLADLIFVSTSRPGNRAQTMGLSRVVWAIPTLVGPMMATAVVTAYGGITVQGMRPLYFIQLISLVAITLFVILKLEEFHARPVIHEERSIGKMGFLDSFRDLFRGESKLREWVIIMGLWRFEISISMAFIALWMVYVKNADQYILGAVSTIGLLTSAFLQVPVGKLADRLGRKRTFLLTRPLTWLGTIILLVAPNPQILLLTGFLGTLGLMGGFSDISFTPLITMFWEVVPTEKRGRWFGLTGILDALAVPAFLIGGFLWQEGFKELVLTLPLLIEATAVIPLLFMVPETLHQNREG